MNFRSKILNISCFKSSYISKDLWSQLKILFCMHLLICFLRLKAQYVWVFVKLYWILPARVHVDLESVSYMILSLLLLKRFRYLYNKTISLDPQRYYKNDLILGRLFREFCLVFQSSFLIKHIPEAVTRYILLKRCSYKFRKVYRKHLRQSFF